MFTLRQPTKRDGLGPMGRLSNGGDLVDWTPLSTCSHRLRGE